MSETSLIFGDCLHEVHRLADASIHAVCTDPPYGLVEFSAKEVAKLRAKKGGIWRLPPNWDGVQRRPLPRFTVLSADEKQGIQDFFECWAKAFYPKLRPGAHVLIAGNPLLQLYVQNGLLAAGYEHRATLLRLYHGFRGGDRPKNAELEFPGVCVSPRGNYEPWLLFRKPITERTVAQNLRKWGTGGLRMLKGDKPLPDVISSFKTPGLERAISDHPSLKPQHLLRIFARSLLPLGKGTIMDPFMGSGSTVAACHALGYDAIGMEIDRLYFNTVNQTIPRLASLYPGFDGSTLEPTMHHEKPVEASLQLRLLDSP